MNSAAEVRCARTTDADTSTTRNSDAHSSPQSVGSPPPDSERAGPAAATYDSVIEPHEGISLILLMRPNHVVNYARQEISMAPAPNEAPELRSTRLPADASLDTLK